MKHLLILFTLMSSFSLTNAQQWLGSTNQNNLIYRNGEITASDGGMYRVASAINSGCRFSHREQKKTAVQHEAG